MAVSGQDLIAPAGLTEQADTKSSLDHTTIAGLAELCLRGFQQCLHLSAPRHPRDLALIEDQLARFSIWATRIGVFASGRASMDHRLRETPEVQAAVCSMLEALEESIQTCLSTIGTPESCQDWPTLNFLAVQNDDLESSLVAVGKEIGMLYRLTNTIRRASRETQNLKAAKSYRIRDDEGNDAESLLQELYANYIRGRFPDINDNLQKRLAFSMVLRRKRILYRRSRYAENPIRTTKVVTQPKVEIPEAQNQAFNGPEISEDLADGVENVNPIPTKSIVQSQAASATTLAVEDYRNVLTPSIISATKTVALANHEALVFPPAPNGQIQQRYRKLKKQREEEYNEYVKGIRNASSILASSVPKLADSSTHHEHLSLPTFNPNIEQSELEHKLSEASTRLTTALELDWIECNRAIPEVICPYCLYAIPSLSVAKENKWKDHVVKDLDAYVCLFDECDEPEQLFAHSSDWLRHMHEHMLRWRCNSKSHRPLTFLTEKEYLNHMREGHSSSLSEPQLRVLAKRNTRPIMPMFKFCPICGTDEAKDNLESHIVGHLRFLAIRSLPPHDEDGSQSSEHGQGSEGVSKPTSRSTIKMDFEGHIRPMFTDAGPLGQDPVGANSSSINVYAPWGGYKAYIASCAGDTTHQHPKMGADPTKHFPELFAVHNHESHRRFLWFNDPSRYFVEESLFDEIPTQEHRLFEWGFVTRLNDQSLESLRDDPIIHKIGEHKPKGQISQSSSSAQLHTEIGNLAARQHKETISEDPHFGQVKVIDDSPPLSSSPFPIDTDSHEHSENRDKEALTSMKTDRGELDNAEKIETRDDNDTSPRSRCYDTTHESTAEAGNGEYNKDSDISGSGLEVTSKRTEEKEREQAGSTAFNDLPSTLDSADHGTCETIESIARPPPTPQPTRDSPSPESSAHSVLDGGNEDKDHLRPIDLNDSKSVADTISRALNGHSTVINTKALIETLPKLTHEQIMELRVEYKKIVKTGSERRGVNIAKHIRARLTDQDPLLMDSCYATALGRWESEAYWSNLWYHDHDIRDRLVIEALVGRSNDEIRAIKDAFLEGKYENSLQRCINEEVEDDKLKKAILYVLEERRMEEWGQDGKQLPIDDALVKDDVRELQTAIKSKDDSDMSMLHIILRRSDPHLRKVLDLYQSQFKLRLTKEMLKKAGNLAGEVMAHMLNGATNRPARDAILIHDGLSVSNRDRLHLQLLIPRLVRCHWDRSHMRAVTAAYQDRYAMSLRDAVSNGTSGDRGAFCIGLCTAWNQVTVENKDGQILSTYLYETMSIQDRLIQASLRKER